MLDDKIDLAAALRAYLATYVPPKHPPIVVIYRGDDDEDEVDPRSLDPRYEFFHPDDD